MHTKTAKGVRLAAAVVALAAVTGCVTAEEQRAQQEALEAKVNQALQNAAAAKVDATTALHIALEAEKAAMK